MPDFLSVGGIALMGFLSTSTDSLFLLIALVAQLEGQALLLRTSYLLATHAVLFVAFLIAQLGNFIPVDYLGFLGLVPILLGARGLYQWWLQRGEVEPVVQARAGLLGYTLLFISISADNLVVMSSLLADSNRYGQLVTLLVYIVAAFGLALLTGYLQRHMGLVSAVRRLSPAIVPIGLVGVGSYILLDTVADRL